jgi:hypothetical protein
MTQPVTALIVHANRAESFDFSRSLGEFGGSRRIASSGEKSEMKSFEFFTHFQLAGSMVTK